MLYDNIEGLTETVVTFYFIVRYNSFPFNPEFDIGFGF